MDNTDDDDEADEADARWEAALSEYWRGVEALKLRLPETARVLGDVSFHDFNLLEFRQSTGPGGAGLAAFLLEERGAHARVTYALAGSVREHAPPEAWPFSTGRPYWLYDELDEEGAAFVHRVFLSDGRVLEIPFATALLTESPAAAPSIRPPTDVPAEPSAAAP